MQLAAVRSGKLFPPSEKKGEEIKAMMDWAFGGFQPMGADAFLPSAGMYKSSSHKNTVIFTLNRK